MEHHKWELTTIDQIYQIDHFKYQTLSYDHQISKQLIQLFRHYYQQNHHQFHPHIQSIDQNEFILNQSDLLSQKEKEKQHFDIIKMLDQQFDQIQQDGVSVVVVFSNLQKCKILPRVQKSNLKVINCYLEFIQKYNISKFDKSIMKKKHLNMQKLIESKKKENNDFMDLVRKEDVGRVIQEIKGDKKVLETIDMSNKNQNLEHLVCDLWYKNSIYELIAEVKDDLDFNRQDCENATPVFRLISSKRCMADKIELIEYLQKEYRIEIEHKDNQDRTPLYWLCCQQVDDGDDCWVIEMIEYMINVQKCNVNQRSKLKRTGLSKACYLGLEKVVKYLLENKTKYGIDVNQQDEKGRTPLHNSCWGIKGGRKGKIGGNKLLIDSKECTSLLIQHGCNIHQKDYQGCSALYSACTSEGIDSMKVLLDNGVKLSTDIVEAIIKYCHYQVIQVLQQQYQYQIDGQDYLKYLWLIYENEQCQDQQQMYIYLMENVMSRHSIGLVQSVYENQLQYDRQKDIQHLWKLFIELAEKYAINIQKSQWDRLLYKLDYWCYEWLYFRIEGLDKSGQWECLITNDRLGYLIKVEYELSIEDGRLVDLMLSSKSSRSKDIMHFMYKLVDSIDQVFNQNNDNVFQMLLANDQYQVLVRLVNLLKKKAKETVITKMLGHLNQDGLDFRMMAIISKKLQYNLLFDEKDVDYKIQEFKVELVEKQVDWSVENDIGSMIQEIEQCQVYDYIKIDYQFKDGIEYVNSKEQVMVLENIRMEEKIGVDCEFSVVNGRGLISLIQISTSSTNYVIDVQQLRIDGVFQILRQTLQYIFQNINVLKIMHGCENDLKYLGQDLQLSVLNVFDTARLDKLVIKSEQYRSLAQLAMDYLAIKMDKSMQNCEWRIRPLFAKQIQYAVQDSRILMLLYDSLLDKFFEQGLDSITIWKNGLQLVQKACLQRINDKYYQEVTKK